jgi:hypothetical protein
MQQIPHIYQTLYSELAQRSLDAAFTSEFNINGRFITVWLEALTKNSGGFLWRSRKSDGTDPSMTEHSGQKERRRRPDGLA